MSLTIGTNIAYGPSSANITINEITETDFPDEVVESIERLTHSIADFRKRSVPGMIEPGECSFKVFSDSGHFAALNTYKIARTVLFWEFETPSTETYPISIAFKAFITSCKPIMNGVGQLHDIEVKLKLTGESISYS